MISISNQLFSVYLYTLQTVTQQEYYNFHKTNLNPSQHNQQNYTGGTATSPLLITARAIYFHCVTADVTGALVSNSLFIAAEKSTRHISPGQTESSLKSSKIT